MFADCLCENTHDKDRAKMRRLIQWRRGEVNAVYHEKELIDILVAMSRKLEEYMQGMLGRRRNLLGLIAQMQKLQFSLDLFSPVVDIDDMEERQQIDIEVNPLNVFMEVHPFDLMASDMAGIVTYFELDEDIREMAEVLHTFQDSRLFKACWEKAAKLLVDEEMDEPDIIATPEMIHDDIFTPSYEEYKKIYTCLKDGHITLAQVNELFADYKGKYEELAQQLDLMCRIEKGSNTDWILRRVQQIEQYHELHLAVASATIIMTVKETLGLQGDFRALETLMEAVSGHVLTSFARPREFSIKGILSKSPFCLFPIFLCIFPYELYCS